MKAEHSPENVARVTGIAAETIVALARAYAAGGTRWAQAGGDPAELWDSAEREWRDGGAGGLHAAAVDGGVEVQGRRAAAFDFGAFPFDSDALQMPELMKASPLGRAARVVNMSQLGQALTRDDAGVGGPPVKAMFVYNSNPAAVAPNQNDVLRGMAREDLFTVVHEQFFTDTADYADVVLPAPTFLEMKDVQGAYGHLYAQVSQQGDCAAGRGAEQCDDCLASWRGGWDLRRAASTIAKTN